VAADAVYDWTGGYIGAKFGYRGAPHPVNIMFTPASSCAEPPTIPPSGFLRGGPLRYNFPNRRLGFRVQGDIPATALKQSICFDFCNPGLTFRLSQEMPWFATVRGRIGYAAGPALFYATGGAAFTDVKTSLSVVYEPFGTVAGDFSDTRTGWVVG